MIDGHWLSIPVVHHAVLLLCVAVAAPLIFGLVARALIFRLPDDDK
jgi:hypothetical protein